MTYDALGRGPSIICRADMVHLSCFSVGRNVRKVHCQPISGIDPSLGISLRRGTTQCIFESPSNGDEPTHPFKLGFCVQGHHIA